MQSSELERVAADCLEIAGRAAALCMPAFGRRDTQAQGSVMEKGKNDLVTTYDYQSQALVTELLSARYPGVAILGEESAPETPQPTRVTPRAELAFAVDPIDGTTNFVHGHPFWCVSIGLIESGVPVAGAVTAPALGLSWHGWAAQNGRALFRNGEPRRVSQTGHLAQALVATGFPTNREHAPDNNFASFMAVKRRVRAVRRCGSAALDCCFVADGTYDAYWERLIKVWDAAAGAALVLGGGGMLTNMEGGQANLERGHIVLSNGRIHQAVLQAIAANPDSV